MLFLKLGMKFKKERRMVDDKKVIRFNKEVDIFVKKDVNGVDLINYRTLKKFDAVACFGDKRLVINGQFQITQMSGSYKFGNQIQLKVFCNKTDGFRVEERNDSNFNIFEINIPEELGHKLLEQLYLNLQRPEK